MSRLSGCARTGRFAGVVASAALLAAVVPGGSGSAAPSRQRTVHHANLSATVTRLPNYFPGVVHWKVSTSLRHYGTTNWDTNTIAISAFTPLSLLYPVIAHEWSHEVQAYDYNRHFWGLVKAMNRHFGGAGGSGQRGVEYSADCMAILQGARWTDYTACRHKKWRHYAKLLLEGRRLPAPHRHHRAGHPSTAPAPAQPTPAPYPQPDRYPAPNQYSIDIHR